MGRDKTFSGFMGATFDLIGENAGPLLLFVAVLGGLNTVGLLLGYIDAVGSLASIGFGFNIDPADGVFAGLFQIGVGVLSIVASYLLLARLLESQGRLPVRQTRIWAYIGLSILSVLGYMLGFLLLIIPGLILLVRWSATSGYLIERRLGVIDCMTASWDATRGSSWPIFLAGLVLFLGLMVIGGAIGGIGSVIGSNPVTVAFSSLAEVAGNALFLAYGIAVYLLVDDNARDIGDVFA